MLDYGVGRLKDELVIVQRLLPSGRITARKGTISLTL